MIASESHIGILDVPVSHVICTVNTEGHMGRGVALYLKKCIPGLYDAYREQCKQKQLLVNTLWVYENNEPKILCFPTKDKTWEDSRLEWIEANLRTLRDTYRERGITSVAMPPLGCGNGNLKWEDVRPLIYAILGDCDLQVHICLGRKLPVPDEDGDKHIKRGQLGEKLRLDLMTDKGVSLNHPAFYVITHVKSGSFYIGSTSNAAKRKHHHLWTLVNNQHYNHRLQELYESDPSFYIDIYKFDSLETAREIEQRYITYYLGNPLCCNVSGDACHPTKGRPLSQENKNGISAALTGRKMDRAWRKKLSDAKLGAVQSEDTKLKKNEAIKIATLNNPWQHKAAQASAAVLSKKVSIQGVIYNSITVACNHLKLTHKVISRRLQSNKPEYADWFILDNKVADVNAGINSKPNPSDDGTTHCNIWTKGRTSLGRKLSNLSRYGFLHEDHGWFECLEGYWYWLATGCRHEQFKQMHGFDAKSVGSKMERVEMPDFQERFKEGMRLRLEQNADIRNELLNSTLPFEHYYVYGDNVVRDVKARHQWQLDFYDAYRKAAAVEQKVVNVLVAGGRGFNNVRVFDAVMDEQLAHFATPFDRDYDINLITGLAHSGPDDMTIDYSRKRGHKLTGWPALWDKYQKRAGMIRNSHMSKQDLHYAVIFWDGESRGTKNMIDLLVKNDIAHFIYIYPKE